MAALGANEEAIAALLAAGAEVNALNFANRTPLDVALDHGALGAAERLARSGGTTRAPVADVDFSAAFERAADAVVRGETGALRKLLDERPALATARSSRPHRCTLLNYLGANGFEHWRQKTPDNAVAVIDLLLQAGADANAVCYTYRGGPEEDTAGLLTSSDHPRRAGLTLAMLAALARGGMRATPAWEVLIALHEGRSRRRLAETAAAQVARAPAACGLALVASAGLGEEQLALALLDAGVDVNARQPDATTALHQAAFAGDSTLVEALLRRGADPTLRDDVHAGTAAGWAHAGGHPALAKRLG